MSLNLTPESKNTLTLTNEPKGGNSLTWDGATFAWEDAGDQTWDSNGYLVLNKESKNTLTLTNEAKN